MNILGASLKFEWDKTIIEKLQSSSKKNEIVDNSLKKAIVPIHDQITKNLKVHKSKIKHEHLQDNIPINEITVNGDIHQITTGFNKDDNSQFFYAKFLEWGTSKMSAKPFMQPAYNSKKGEAFEIMQETVKEELGL